MTEKCVNTGNWIEMCESLTEVTRNQYGDIQAQVMSARSQNASRLRIVAGRFKKNRVEHLQYQLNDDECMRLSNNREILIHFHFKQLVKSYFGESIYLELIGKADDLADKRLSEKDGEG